MGLRVDATSQLNCLHQLSQTASPRSTLPRCTACRRSTLPSIEGQGQGIAEHHRPTTTVGQPTSRAWCVSSWGTYSRDGRASRQALPSMPLKAPDEGRPTRNWARAGFWPKSWFVLDCLEAGGIVRPGLYVTRLHDTGDVRCSPGCHPAQVDLTSAPAGLGGETGGVIGHRQCSRSHNCRLYNAGP